MIQEPAGLGPRQEILDEALELIARATRDGKALSVGLLGNAAEVLPEMLRRGVRPDAVTDQTSAHDPLFYLPVGVPFEEWQDYFFWSVPEGNLKDILPNLGRFDSAVHNLGFMG